MRGQEPQTPGLFGSLRALAASLVALAHTRLELLGAELQEEVARVVLSLLYSFTALLFAALGIAFVGIAIIMAVEESHRVEAAAILALIFLVLGGTVAWAVRRLVFAKLRVFDASLLELDKDYAELKKNTDAQNAGKRPGGAEKTR